MRKRNSLGILVIMLLLISTFVLANSRHSHESEIEEGKKLVESEISCDKLNDGQLEAIGEYLMEQMHPGEAHEMMDKMMGGEGSDSLKQMHIQMARRLYCNEDVSGMMGMMGSGGMMNMMMGGGNMMSSGMIGGQNVQSGMMQGMMGNWGYGSGYWNFVNILYVILLIGLVILVYLWIIKLWRNMKKKGRKK